tara:strand:- start:584 stop:2350 length:1767 start_codon:yes stop_codon:yes gene_type:complete
MSNRRWTGFSTWKKWKAAGVVGEKLGFTDDDIITHQTLARTAERISFCRAMDAAVSYELASAGSDTIGVIPNTLLSDYTRAAYIIESTNYVGWGVHSDTEQESCGHDEAESVTYYTFKGVKRISYFKEHDTVLVYLKNGVLDTDGVQLDGLTAIEQNRLVHCRADGKYNMSTGTVKTDTTTPLELYMKYLSVKFPSLQEYLDKGSEIRFDGPIIKSKKTTLGVCKIKEGEKCRHHGQITKRGWAMYVEDDKFVRLYESFACNKQWNNDMLKVRQEQDHDHNGRMLKKVKPATGKPCFSPNWVTWESQRRSMLRKVDDKKVLSMIRKSLGRMSRRNVNIVRKTYLRRCVECGTDFMPNEVDEETTCCGSHENIQQKMRGNNAVYKWKDWGWLVGVHAYIQTTRTKNRKAGDVENGWEWFACNTKTSYGMDMSDFAWKPKNSTDLVMYTFSVTSETKPYAGASYTNTTKVLDFSQVLLFHTKEAAQTAAEGIVNSLLKTSGAVVKSRVYTEGEFAPRPNYTVSYNTVSSTFQMKAEIDPEDYMSPKEINKLAVTAAPSVLAPHRQKFTTWSTPVSTKTVKPKKEKEGDDE